MVIEKIYAENFQCWENIEVELSPTVTTFIGTNDVGKSSLLRILRWVALNKPAGSRIIRIGAKETLCEITVDGTTVGRVRGEHKNLYTLDGAPLKAFATEVPDVVAKALNVGDLNFQRQLDLHLWFSDTAGQVARELNAIINLDLIDTSLAAGAAHIRSQRAAHDLAQNQLQRARRERDDLAWSLEADEAYRAVEALETASQDTSRRVAHLRTQTKRGLSAHEKAADARCRAKQSDSALLVAKAAMEAGERVAGLRGKIKNLKAIDATRKGVRRCLEETEAKIATVKACPVCGRPIAPRPS